MKWALMVFCLLLAGPLLGAREPIVFESPQEQARFDELTVELRCLVCQNQSLADSDAPLAQDLRDEILLMLRAGSSDEEIKRFLVERYGDFVLYRPPVKGNTLVLWLAPLVLLLVGAVIVGLSIKRRSGLLDNDGTREP